MGRLLVDLTPLRHSPAYRRLWVGTGLSSVGSQMTVFAVVLQVFQLTGSSFAVGAVGLFVAVPSLLFGLLGGTVADAFDRRLVVLLTSCGMALIAVVLTVQAYAGLDRLWLLYLLVALQSLLGAVGVPARRTLLPRLLPAGLVPAGVSLSLLSMHVSQIAGPVLAGLVAAAWGVQACYLIDTLTFAAALYGIARLPAVPPEPGVARPGFRAVGEAVRFIRTRPVLKGAFLADLGITTLGVPTALFPAVNAANLGGSARTLGLLTAATAVGGLLGTAFSGPVGRVSRPGRATIAAGLVWGAAVAGFGLSTELWLALGLLVVAGAADVLSVVFCQTIVQTTTPDRLRGRVTAAEHVITMGGPQLGNFRAGTVGSLTSPTVGIVSGGLASMAAGLLIAVTLPAFVRYRADARPAPDPAPAPGAAGLPPTPG